MLPLRRRLSSSRQTVPWVELPGDTKRAADAAVLGRRLASPKVTLKLEEARRKIVELYKEGLIYRAQRLINWCPTCRTALSDHELGGFFLRLPHGYGRREAAGVSEVKF